MESIVRSVSSVSTEESAETVETYRSPDLEYLAYEENLWHFKHRTSMEVDGIVSSPKNDHERNRVLPAPMFSFKYDPEDVLDYNTLWRSNPDIEIDLDHFVYCGIQWTAEMLAETTHHCLLPDRYKEKSNGS